MPAALNVIIALNQLYINAGVTNKHDSTKTTKHLHVFQWKLGKTTKSVSVSFNPRLELDESICEFEF